LSIKLNAAELAELDKQNPATEKDGGYQTLLVGLQRRVNRATGELVLTGRDLERIQRYAYDYKRGGWQSRLERIFGRTLGPNLGRRRLAA
jgi:hypothetical protein